MTVHALIRGDLSNGAAGFPGSVLCDNAQDDWAEVSRGHSSCLPAMKDRTWNGELRSMCSWDTLHPTGCVILWRVMDWPFSTGVIRVAPACLPTGRLVPGTARCGPARRVVWGPGAKEDPRLPAFRSTRQSLPRWESHRVYPYELRSGIVVNMGSPSSYFLRAGPMGILSCPFIQPPMLPGSVQGTKAIRFCYRVCEELRSNVPHSPLTPR